VRPGHGPTGALAVAVDGYAAPRLALPVSRRPRRPVALPPSTPQVVARSRLRGRQEEALQGGEEEEGEASTMLDVGLSRPSTSPMSTAAV